MTATALWFDAWLRGSAGSDDLLDQLARSAPDAPARVAIDGVDHELSDLLRSLRGFKAPRTWLLLPRPGRTGGWPAGIGGPPEPAVLISGAGAANGLLRSGQAGWCWDSCGDSSVALLESGMLTARAGARALAEAAAEAAGRLESLGLERPATRAHRRQWETAMQQLPPGLDSPTHSLLIRLAVLHDALDLALVEEGAAVTAAEARSRAGELRAVVGHVEDIISGLVGGLNAPVPAGPAGR
jgi:hypothetical protein